MIIPSVEIGPNQTVSSTCIEQPSCFVMKQFETPDVRKAALETCIANGLVAICYGGRPNTIGGWVCGQEDATHQALAGKTTGNLRDHRSSVVAAVKALKQLDPNNTLEV